MPQLILTSYNKSHLLLFVNLLQEISSHGLKVNPDYDGTGRWNDEGGNSRQLQAALVLGIDPNDHTCCEQSAPLRMQTFKCCTADGRKSRVSCSCAKTFNSPGSILDETASKGLYLYLNQHSQSLKVMLPHM